MLIRVRIIGQIIASEERCYGGIDQKLSEFVFRYFVLFIDEEKNKRETSLETFFLLNFIFYTTILDCFVRHNSKGNWL